MRYLLMLISLLFSAVVFAGKPSVGAIYKGEDSISKTACTVVIKNIEKSLLVDKITTEISISGRASREITFVEYDLSNSSYGRLQDHVTVQQYSEAQRRNEKKSAIEYFSLKVSDDKSEAELQYVLLVENIAMASNIPMVKCMNLKLADPSLDVMPTAVPLYSSEESDIKSDTAE